VRWVLLVDESGHFDVRTEHVAVGALLVPERSLAVLDSALRRAVHLLDPRCPWPLHTAHLRTLTWLAAARHTEVRRQGPAGPRGISSACDTVLEALERTPGRKTERVFQDIATGKKGRWEDLQDLERWLETQPRLRPTRRELRRHQEYLFGGIANAVEAFVQQERRLGATLWAVTSSESTRGNAVQSPLSPDRYVALLQVLVERAGDVLHAQRPGDELAIRPFVRDVRVDGTRRPMRRQDLVELIAAADLPHRLEIMADAPSAYPGAHPGPGFLADLLANSARAHRGNLTALHAVIRSSTGLRPRSGKPARSHCAAHVKARTFILDSRAGRSPRTQDLRGLAPWAQAQALQWSPS